MKKSFFALMTCLVLVLCTVFGACSVNQGTIGGGEPETPTLTIEDVAVAYNERATVNPVFSPESAAGAVAYSFEGENISFNGNVVRGLVGNTETEVTATCGELSTTFKVKVYFKNPFGKNAFTEKFDEVYSPVEDGKFEKTTAEYGEAWFYANETALAGDTYVFTGNMEIAEPTEGAYATVVLQESATKAARLVLAYEGTAEAAEEGAEPVGIYKLYSEVLAEGTFGNRTFLKELDGGVLDFGVLLKSGTAYFYANGVYIGKVDAGFEKAHAGIGGEKSKLMLSKLNAYTDNAHLEVYDELTRVVFGRHALTTSGADLGIFEATENSGEYVKSTTNYGQVFYYQDGLPLAGAQWTMEFTVKVDRDPTAGLPQATFMIHLNDKTMVRFAVEYQGGNNKWVLFNDSQNNGVWNPTFGWTPVAEYRDNLDSWTLNLKIVFNQGTCTLYQDGTQLRTVTVDFLPQAHFGFGGEGTTITLSNLRGSLTAE